MGDKVMSEITAIRTLDNVPVAKGMKVWVTEHTYSDLEDESFVTPRAATVLRMSDGEKRSLLLRSETGTETRWYPEPHEVSTRGLYASLPNARAAAKVRNAKKAKEIKKDIERQRKRLAAFKKHCGLK